MFTTIGELLIDFMPVIEGGRTVGFRMSPGGSPYNVAIALARLGAHAEFAGKSSTDFFGRYLVRHLEQEGVGTRFLSSSPAPSTLAFVTEEGNEPAFTFYGEDTADTLLHPDDLPAPIGSSPVLQFGSISLLRGSTPATITALVEKLRGRALLCFDPNIRPSLIKDEAAYRRLLIRMFEAADIVKMSDTDANWFAPDRPPTTVAAEVQELGPSLVIITEGARGAFARTADTTVQVSAPPVHVVDTVGAGDAFTAAILFAIANRQAMSRAEIEHLRDHALEAIVQFATASAALTCTKVGADPPRRQEVDAFLQRSRIHPT